MIRTKIVATLGPATSSVQTLARLFEEGADVCRLNFSHGSLDEHRERLANLREAAKSAGEPVAVLGDLAGPKIRLLQIADQGESGGLPVEVGQTVIFQRQLADGTGRRVSTNYPHFVDDVRIGDRIYVEDGLIRFVVTEKSADQLSATVTAGGVLRSAKGVNLPGTPLRMPSLTERDWECVQWAIDNDLDYLALSFVRKAEDLKILREHLNSRNSGIQLIAKIEKSEAVEQIDPIIEACDGMMIARGDLGVEMDVAQVPIIQKDLVRRAQAAGKFVIVATQMLQSMIENASPTRAEVSDVANAIFDGADAVMLSGETSIGKYPLPAVHTMNHVADVTEQYICTSAGATRSRLKIDPLPLSAAVARGVWQTVQDMPAKVVAIWCRTGTTARLFSRYRFPMPILGLSADPHTLRRMQLYYGIIPVQMDRPESLNQLIERVDDVVLEHKLAGAGDSIVVVAGSSLHAPGTLNSVVIHTVGRHWEAVANGRQEFGELEKE